MSTEEEFSLWLRRPEQPIKGRVNFAINTWKSAEFNVSRKFEIVLDWLADCELQEIGSIPTSQLLELLQQRAQPGLASQSVKKKFVARLLQLSGQLSSKSAVDLLFGLIEFEILQDLLRKDYELQGRIYDSLLCHYENYLLHFDKETSSAQETKLFTKLLASLKDNAKRCTDIAQFDASYCGDIIQPLVQVVLTLRKQGICFFDDFLSLERVINQELTDAALLDRLFRLPLHVSLLALECAIVCRRSVEPFLKLLLTRVFQELFEKQRQQDAGLALMVAAYTLEMLRKHDVNLAFSMESQESALAYLGKHLYPWVQKAKDNHLREVLMLLCAALRLNPLILEQYIFQLTTWIIVAPKKADEEEQRLFEEYLVLLIEVFRRLSQTEKFVGNLLKTLKQWLQKFNLVIERTPRKRAAVEHVHTPTKKHKSSRKDDKNEIELNASANNIYLHELFSHFSETERNQQIGLASEHRGFPALQSYWPSESAGAAFSSMTTGLVSKPSLVIWKTLLHALKELIESLSAKEPLSENLLLQLDLLAAILSQYLCGSKLTEQLAKFGREVREQCDFMAQVLGQFGRFVLASDCCQRVIDAFLECSYHASNFKLQLAYYLPDGMAETLTASPGNLHAHLDDQEWSHIERRIFKLGKSSSKFLWHRLLMQRLEMQLLVSPGSRDSTSVSLCESLHLGALNEYKHLPKLLRTTNAQWLATHLPNDEKLQIVELLRNSGATQVISRSEDPQAVASLALHLYEDICSYFSATDNTLILSTSSCDLKSLRACGDASALHQATQTVIKAINAYTVQCSSNTMSVSLGADVSDTLDQLRQLPISYLPGQSKILIFVLQLAFYCDLKCMQADELATKALDLLTSLLHFGPRVAVFQLFDCHTIMKLFAVSQCSEFYAVVLMAIKSADKTSERFLIALGKLLQESQTTGSISADELQLLLLVIQVLSSMLGPSAKRMRKHLVTLLVIYAEHVNMHFDQHQKENAKKTKKFVDKTICGFAAYVSVALAQSNETSEGQYKFAIDEQFKRICKVYIGHSLDYRNVHAIRLMQVALNYRQQLNFDQDEIEFVLSAYWQQLNVDLNQQDGQLKGETVESVVKMIMCNKTNEDLLLTLKEIEASVGAKDCQNVMRLLALIGKCPLSTIKGAIFNEQFKHITQNMVVRLLRNERHQFIDAAQVRCILGAQLALVENKMIPITMDTLDSILAFLIDINLKKFSITDSSIEDFRCLHLAITELCSSLLKYRHLLLLDRVPQFMHIFKDSIQSLILYKSERQKETTLPASELDVLAELAHKLEAVMHLLGTHGTTVKRVAPFVLIFVITLMVGNNRVTTLYPKIKTPIDSICYELVGICDHRVGSFILRSSNEAVRLAYESYVKNHKKYHKFTGKV